MISTVYKILIKYNNNLEKNDEEEKESLILSLLTKNADPEMMKMLLTFDDRI